jgi:Putative prokaryotic signal transducing protein
VLRIVLASSNAADLAVARSILGAIGVEYVVRNEHALLIPLVHATELLVDEDDAEKATAMLRHAGLLT